MKFEVTTVPDTSDVDLKLYVDDGSGFVLMHELVDYPGFWLSTSSTTVPPECPQSDGDTVLRPGNVCFLRSDGEDTTTEVHWKDVSISNTLTSVRNDLIN